MIIDRETFDPPLVINQGDIIQVSGNIGSSSENTTIKFSVIKRWSIKGIIHNTRCWIADHVHSIANKIGGLNR